MNLRVRIHWDRQRQHRWLSVSCSQHFANRAQSREKDAKPHLPPSKLAFVQWQETRLHLITICLFGCSTTAKRATNYLLTHTSCVNWEPIPRCFLCWSMYLSTSFVRLYQKHSFTDCHFSDICWRIKYNEPIRGHVQDICKA